MICLDTNGRRRGDIQIYSDIEDFLSIPGYSGILLLGKPYFPGRRSCLRRKQNRKRMKWLWRISNNYRFSFDRYLKPRGALLLISSCWWWRRVYCCSVGRPAVFIHHTMAAEINFPYCLYSYLCPFRPFFSILKSVRGFYFILFLQLLVTLYWLLFKFTPVIGNRKWCWGE